MTHVIRLAVKEPVGSLLQEFFDRRGDHHDHSHRHHRDDDSQSNLARRRRIAERVHARAPHDPADEERNRQRRQRIDDCATHDYVNIHQAIAHDRMAEGERNQNQRQDRHVRHPAFALNSQHMIDAVERCQRRDGDNRSGHHPLELLSNDSRLALDKTPDEHSRAEREREREVYEANFIEATDEIEAFGNAETRQPRRRDEICDRCNRQQEERGHIQQDGEPASLV